MSIKSVVVKTKPFAFNVGDKLFTCEFFGSQSLIVLSPLEIDGWVEKVKVLITDSRYGYTVGREDYIFPGDLGVPGFTYDDRKCSLFRSKIAANTHDGVYAEWLKSKPVRDWEPHFDFNGYYYD